MPAFWRILKKTREQGVSLHKLSSHGCYVLNSSFDKPEYDHILDFLGVRPVSSEWYVKCIQDSNIVMGVSEETYLELLHFLAVNWQSEFHRTGMGNIPLIKYVRVNPLIVTSSQASVFVLCFFQHHSSV
ncbi:hypothetical protein D5086_028580 [Populus alba]|uniref:Uncharacterized protein n=1 Tax=Populus alba TaxID=43335 RepID=A0ACC4AYM7_POPAL